MNKTLTLIALIACLCIGATTSASAETVSNATASTKANEVTVDVDEPPQRSFTIGFHLYTYHFDKSQGYNNVNPGIYVVKDGWTAGAYYNSERKASAYAGYTFFKVFGVPIDITLGAITGYEKAAVLPLVVPSVAWKGVRLSLLLPPERSGWAAHISYEF